MAKLVSFLVPDIGAPTIGAALRLARALEPKYRTEIIGPDFGRGVCSLYRGSYPFRVIPAGKLYRLPDYWWESKCLAEIVSGDLVVAVKAFASTVPVALKVKRARHVPCLVYLDEWDGALWHGKSRRAKLACLARHLHHPDEACYLPFVEGFIRQSDSVISTTSWLQRRFGGHIVHAGVDTSHFQPQPTADVARLKQALGLTEKKVIVFGGVVRPHKGVEEILTAMERLADDQIRLLIAGPVTEHLHQMMQSTRWGRWIVVAGDTVDAKSSLNAEVHKNMPLYLDVGDMVVLPLRNTLLSQSQMPIKIFEALAMAKPVIGSAVADLPLVLEGCGKIVPSDDVETLAAAINEVLTDDQMAAEMGRKAREKCIREYSAEVTKNNLLRIISEVLG